MEYAKRNRGGAKKAEAAIAKAKAKREREARDRKEGQRQADAKADAKKLLSQLADAGWPGAEKLLIPKADVDLGLTPTGDKRLDYRRRSKAERRVGKAYSHGAFGRPWRHVLLGVDRRRKVRGYPIDRYTSKRVETSGITYQEQTYADRMSAFILEDGTIGYSDKPGWLMRKMSRPEKREPDWTTVRDALTQHLPS
ncbi:MAG: hypothetical protein R8F63_08595 [Acidimicrobiales bacterium]|nr:hypothetical protein [Acidimicrobiales bacterium]